MYISEPIKRYLDDLAAKRPAPGGGSASALAGAIGAGLSLMALNYTAGKPEYATHEENVREAIKELEKIKTSLEGLLDEDIARYTKLNEARAARLPKKELEPFLVDAVYVPVKIFNLCLDAMGICHEIVDKTNKNLITDIACGAVLLAAAFHAACYNVEINLDSMEPDIGVIQMRKDITLKSREIEKIKKAVLHKAGLIMRRKQ